MKIFDVAIIGAGAAGIMAAIAASGKGRSVILLEKNTDIGRKILATGNGRCNLTNRNVVAMRFHGANPDFIQKILSGFDQTETMKYFESLGVILKEEDRGRIFPRANKASTVVDALASELSRLRVEIKTDCLVIGMERGDNWIIKIKDSESVTAKKIIITTGGRAANQFGSSGDGLHFAKKIGHTLTPIFAALVPLEIVESWPKDIQGLKIEGKATVMAKDKIISEKIGDILFTHYGLSGPAIMDQSRAVAAIVDKEKVEIHIDATPEETAVSLNKKIEQIFNANGAKTVKNALCGVVPENLVAVVLKNISIDADKKSARVSKEERSKIVESLKNLILTVKGAPSLKEAQVTAGGVSADEIDPKTMESKIIPGLYFAGEIIDVDGDSGGFNLQWAWSSGHLAGLSATR